MRNLCFHIPVSYDSTDPFSLVWKECPRWFQVFEISEASYSDPGGVQGDGCREVENVYESVEHTLRLNRTYIRYRSIKRRASMY